jgi:hypothetical protein
VFAATSPLDGIGGVYLKDDDISPLDDDPKPFDVAVEEFPSSNVVPQAERGTHGAVLVLTVLSAVVSRSPTIRAPRPTATSYPPGVRRTVRECDDDHRHGCPGAGAAHRDAGYLWR